MTKKESRRGRFVSTRYQVISFVVIGFMAETERERERERDRDRETERETERERGCCAILCVL